MIYHFRSSLASNIAGFFMHLFFVSVIDLKFISEIIDTDKKPCPDTSEIEYNSIYIQKFLNRIALKSALRASSGLQVMH